MSIRKIVPLLVMGLVFSALSIHVNAEQDVPTKAIVLIQIAENVRKITFEYIEQARATGADVRVAMAHIEEGDIILGQARAAYERGEYPLAVFHAGMAQREFRNALRSLGSETPLAEEREEQLLEALRRARDTILRIRSTLLNSTGINQALREQISAKLDLAESLLDEADSLLRVGASRISEATDKLDQSEKLIVECFALLNYASEELNRQRMEGFLSGLEQEISKLRDELERLKLNRIDVKDLEGRLETATKLIESARLKIFKDQLPEAVLAIQQAREIVKQLWAEVAKYP